MARKTILLLGILTTIAIGTFLFANLCSGCIRDLNNEAPIEEIEFRPNPKKPVLSYPFAFQENDFALRVGDNFDFNVSNPSFLMPISTELKTGIQKLKGFLGENPEKIVEITGYYTSKEENNTSFANLGLARATSVKNHLVLSGISDNQIIARGKSNEDLVSNGSEFLGAISYAISEQNSTEHQP